MKYKLILFVILSISIISTLDAQNPKDTSNVEIHFKQKSWGKSLDKILIVKRTEKYNKSVKNDCYLCDLKYGVQYKGTFGSVIIPVNFNYMELKGDSVSIGTAMNLGLGYTWMKGSFYVGQDDDINLNYNLIYGFAISSSFKTNSGKIKSSLLVGGFVGVKTVSLFVGYDPFNNNWNFGIGTKIDINSFRNDKITIWGKSLRAKYIPKNAKSIPEDNLTSIINQFD